MSFWSGAEGGVEPLRKYRFKVLENSKPSWWIKTVSKPSFEISMQEYQLINHKFKYPGILTWNDIEMTIVDIKDDTNGYKSISFMKKIIENGYYFDGSNVDGIQKKQEGYNFAIQQIDSEGTQIEKWTLINPWIKSIKFGDLDYSSDELVEISLTISYDSATIEKEAK